MKHLKLHDGTHAKTLLQAGCLANVLPRSQRAARELPTARSKALQHYSTTTALLWQ